MCRHYVLYTHYMVLPISVLEYLTLGVTSLKYLRFARKVMEYQNYAVFWAIRVKEK